MCRPSRLLPSLPPPPPILRLTWSVFTPSRHHSSTAYLIPGLHRAGGNFHSWLSKPCRHFHHLSSSSKQQQSLFLHRFIVWPSSVWNAQRTARRQTLGTKGRIIRASFVFLILVCGAFLSTFTTETMHFKKYFLSKGLAIYWDVRFASVP